MIHDPKIIKTPDMYLERCDQAAKFKYIQGESWNTVYLRRLLDLGLYIQPGKLDLDKTPHLASKYPHGGPYQPIPPHPDDNQNIWKPPSSQVVWFEDLQYMNKTKMNQETETKPPMVQVVEAFLLFLVSYYQLSESKSGFLTDGAKRTNYIERGEHLPKGISSQGQMTYFREKLNSVYAKRSFLERVRRDFNNDSWIDVPSALADCLIKMEGDKLKLSQDSVPRTFNYHNGVTTVMKCTFDNHALHDSETPDPAWKIRQFMILKLIPEL